MVGRRSLPRTRSTAAITLLVLLAACGGHEDRTPANVRTATISFAGSAGDSGAAQTVSIAVPGFAGRFGVPGLNLGSDLDIDGLRLHPGARTTAVKISGAAGDGSGGETRGAVDLGFLDPAPPATVLAYYRDAARAAGWQETPPAAGQQFAATKVRGGGTQTLALQIGAKGSGSTGRILVGGS